MRNGDQHGQEQSHDEHHLARQGGDIHEQEELEVQSFKCVDATISKDGGCKVDIPLRITAVITRLNRIWDSGNLAGIKSDEDDDDESIENARTSKEVKKRAEFN